MPHVTYLYFCNTLISYTTSYNVHLYLWITLILYTTSNTTYTFTCGTHQYRIPHHIPHTSLLVEHINIVYHIKYHIHLYLWNTLISYTTSNTTYIYTCGTHSYNISPHIPVPHIQIYKYKEIGLKGSVQELILIKV